LFVSASLSLFFSHFLSSRSPFFSFLKTFFHRFPLFFLYLNSLLNFFSSLLILLSAPLLLFSSHFPLFWRHFSHLFSSSLLQVILKNAHKGKMNASNAREDNEREERKRRKEEKNCSPRLFLLFAFLSLFLSLPFPFCSSFGFLLSHSFRTLSHADHVATPRGWPCACAAEP
jgi:hypothetical protein